MSVATPLQQLLADTQWVRRLLRGMLPSGHGADDVLQEACLIALQHPPVAHDHLRAWFARVVANLVRQRRRGDVRRQRRELAHSASRPETAPATDELVERAIVHRSVVDAVLELDEPYRSVILLRYFEDLPARAIAARLSTSVATVHTRLHRGLARLRQQLDRTHGRRTWSALLVAVPAAHAPLFAAITMKVKFIASVVLVATAAATWLLTQNSPPTDLGPSTGVSAVPAATAALASEVAGQPAERASERTRVTAEDAASQPVPTAAAVIARGRVVDTEGNPLLDVHLALAERPDAEVGSSPPAITSTSDASGAFTLAFDRARSGRIVVTDANLGTVLAPALDANAVPALALVVAASRLPLRGRVQAADGSAIANARLRILWPDDLRSRLHDNHDAAAEEEIATSTGPDGSFALAALAVRGARIVTAADGYCSDVRPLPTFADAAMTIELEKPSGRPGTVQGQVVDARGLPIQGAIVGLGRLHTKTDADGSFAIEDIDSEGNLAAVAKGYRRVVAERPQQGKYVGLVTLTLGAVPLTIRGRVVDEHGNGLAAAKVWVSDATLLCAGRDPLVTEGLAIGCTPMGSLFEQFQRGLFGDSDRVRRTTPTAIWPFAMTGKDGTFELGGLEDRDYALRALDGNTLQMVDRAQVRAGSTGIELMLRQDQVFARLQGVVVACDGSPQPGVRVCAQCDAVSVGSTTMHENGTATVVTDATGHFALDRVPKTLVYLRLDGENMLPLEYGRDVGGLVDLVGGDVDNVRITVAVRVHVQIELIDKASADELAVLDDRDRTIIVNVFRGHSRTETDALAIQDGRTPVFVVPDTARTLILRRGGAEVARHSLQLATGSVNTLRL